MKKKGLIIILAIVAILILIIGSVIGSYNDLVESEQDVLEERSQISVQLQRRADLIPNFVETVKGYSDYEQETFTAVTEARSAVMGANSVSEQANAAARLDSAIDVWVNAITEAYPELKASEQYRALQDELAGTENRIAVARKDFNEEAREFNTEIRQFPRSILAGIFGFEAFDYFEADQNAQNVPQVNFD